MPEATPSFGKEGDRLVQAGHYEEALAVYEQVILLDQAHAYLYVGKRDALSQLKQDNEQAIGLHPYPQYWMNRSHAFFQLQCYQQAWAAYEQAIQLDPETASWMYRGHLLAALSRFEEALVAYEQAIQVDPQHAVGYLGKGEVFTALSRFEEARAAYEQGLAVSEQAMRQQSSRQLALRILVLRAKLHHPQAPAGHLSADLGAYVLHSSTYRPFFYAWRILALLRNAMLPGQQGRYRVVGRLSEGELTTSYLAQDLADKRPVLVKVLDRRALPYLWEAAPKRLGLFDPHLECLLGYGVWEDCFYLVTEYLEGPTLQAQIATSAPLSIGRAVPIVEQIAHGLEALALGGIKEGVLEPANILLVREQEIKLLDPGLFSASNRAAELFQLTLTRSPKDLPVGNGLVYGAPELTFESAEPEMRADLYSLACILFELLTGRVPYPSAGKTPREIIAQLMESPPIPSICALRPDLEPAWDTFFQRALAKNPDERYQTTGAFLQALEALPGRGD